MVHEHNESWQQLQQLELKGNTVNKKKQFLSSTSLNDMNGINDMNDMNR